MTVETYEPAVICGHDIRGLVIKTLSIQIVPYLILCRAGNRNIDIFQYEFL
jgi:hypothetical protein